ncbi:hypothetical protein JTE90_027335 [Oedothorax gibbosus]|uniref:Uncharacterized protein n=1 Tax=Oedothorax gibbosus TaxID=931172 RepID=A0AAV6VYZ9_9ARAC|nr:hypothetical protein JTE90_027335 [Oedothorax gibbosus]
MDPCCSSYLIKPAEVVQSTQELSQEFKELKKDADALVAKQEEVRLKIDKEISSVCKKIMVLEKKVGTDPNVESVARSILKTRKLDSEE